MLAQPVSTPFACKWPERAVDLRGSLVSASERKNSQCIADSVEAYLLNVRPTGCGGAEIERLHPTESAKWHIADDTDRNQF